jgi:hypothetical protein
MFDIVRSIAVESKYQSLLHMPSPSEIKRVSTEGSCKRLFLLLVAIRGHDLPLENVDATDSDKRGEQGVYLLRKLGVVKTLEGQNPFNLDKREHLTLVDNLGTTSLIVPSIRSLSPCPFRKEEYASF